MLYKIVRIYRNGKKRAIRRGLTEREAQAHCGNPETSSATCTNAVGKRRTKKLGPWFDAFDIDRGK